MMKKVSVIIPVYNAEKTILDCILSVKRQIYPKFEIIVVNDGSTDHTEKILKSVEGIKIISQKNKGPGAARNAGSKKANCEILVFIDSDCEARDRLWLRKIVSFYDKDKNIAAVASGYNGSIGKEFIEEYAYLELKYRLKSMPVEILTAPSNNISCRKDVFEKIGGFSEEDKLIFAEDILFSYNISRIGKIIWRKEIGVYHKFRNAITGYLKQQEGFAKADVCLFFKNPRLLFKVTHHSNNVYIQIILTALLLLSIIASFLKDAFNTTSLILFFIIIVLNSGFLTLLKNKKAYIFTVKSIFVIFARNLAYILGICKGVLKCVGFVDL